MEWIEGNLSSHPGSYHWYFIPNHKYKYRNNLYKAHAVSKVTNYYIDSSTKSKLCEQEYDDEGYLISESNWGSSHVYHRYSYHQSRHVVIDSMIRVLFDFQLDPNTGKLIEPVKTDTIHQVQIQAFNAAGNLTRLRNILSKKHDFQVIQKLGFFPDSMIYKYDSCGNCNHVVWYTDRKKEERRLTYGYTEPNINGERLIHVNHFGSFGTEIWSFDARKQFTGVMTTHRSVSIEYDENRVINWMKSEQGPLGETSTCKKTFEYNENGDLIKILTVNESDNYKQAQRASLTIKRNQYGLLETDLSGNLVTYTYRRP